MAYGLMMAHSGWRYIVIVVGLIALGRMLFGWFSGSQWSPRDRVLGLVTTIVVDIQLLLGIVVWIMQQRWLGGDSLRSWEHPVIMLLVAAVMHVGWSRAKRAPGDTQRFQTVTVWFLGAGLLLALGIWRIAPF